VADIWGEEDAGYVCSVCEELADREDGRGVSPLNHSPYIDVALGAVC
jgi:hypothetical protein